MFLRTLLALLIGWSSGDLFANSCPFCTAVSQTLRQEMSQTDVVVFASFASSDSDSVSTFEVKKVLKGGSLASSGEKIRVSFFGKGLPNQVFMIMGVGPAEVLWSTPLRVSEKVQEYVNQVLTLSKDDVKARLRFFINHLGESDPIIARDVFDEFASASYSEMLELKDAYNREQLLKWIQDTSISPDRRKLYLVMLGICGHKEDAQIIEKLLKSEDPNRQAGLDALIACYLTLKGEAGLKLIEDLFLNDPKVGYNEIYSTVMAIRFHGTDGKIINPKRLAKALYPLLQRPKLADIIIPDLARWEDWSQIERVVQLFKESENTEVNWVRIPVIKYLRACPLPEAQVALKELEQLDPATFKRATMFFPLPSEGDSSLLQESILPSNDASPLQIKPMKPGLAYAVTTPEFHPESGHVANEPVNLVSLASVVGVFSATLWIGMWLTITGTGRGPKWLLAIFYGSR
ncbi:MAG: hypothetical protein U0930_18440 [Pirellulales bacterium]